MRKSHPAVSVQIPQASADKPSWVKVGVIAVVGFAVGVAWPRLAGIRPGPSAPGEATAAASASPARASDAPAQAPEVPAAPANVTSPSAAPTEPPVPLNNAPPAVLVTHGAVLTCKTDDGRQLKGHESCGNVPAFDTIAQPRLKRLAHCPGAQGASGKLTVVFGLDFTRNKPSFSLGRTTTVGNKDSLEQCLRTMMQNVSLNAVDHEHPLYSVFYSVSFTPRDVPEASPTTSASNAGAPAAPAANAPPSSAPAASDGEPPAIAEVAWQVAIVRDTPRTGAVIARLQRGTKVRVGSGQDGWYRVKYGDGFASEGWLYRGAIGR